jgi:hypothetical protein
MRYAGQHKSTTIKVYTAIHAFTGLPDGARPTVRTIADMAAVSERTVNSATKILMTEGLLQVENRLDAKGRPLPNRYTLLPVPTNKPRSLEVQILADTAKTCGGGVTTKEVPLMIAPLNYFQ